VVLSEEQLWSGEFPVNDESKARYLSALRKALLLMSLPPAQQLQRTAPACVACELLDEFEMCCNDVLENVELEEDQSRRFYELQNLSGDMQAADLECFNARVLERPSWQKLRVKSHDALIAMGWQDASLEPFTEVEPGVWVRRRLEPDK
jgi:hypothetical protein